MAAQTSRASALFFLLIIMGVIGTIGYFAWQWSQPGEPEPSSSSTQSESDPNTFNIDEQLDMLQ